VNKIKNIISWIFKSKIRTIVLVAILVAIGFVIYRNSKSMTAAPQYQTTTAQKGSLVSTVSASGEMLTANIVNISTEAEGVVSKVYVKDGDKVNKGQKLVELTLDQTGAQNNAQDYSSYLSAQNSLNNALANQFSLQSTLYSKWKTFTDIANSSTYLNADNTPREDQRTLTPFTIAQDDWLAAEANYKNSQNQVAQARANLNSTLLSYQASSPIITSPMVGTINNITLAEGMSLIPVNNSSTNAVEPQRIAVIEGTGNPLATFNLSEIDVSKVQIGQKATVTLSSITGKTYTGTVISVDRIGSISSNVTNYPVVIKFDTDAVEALPNMSASANIIIDSKDEALLIPSTAVQTQNGQTIVRVLENNIVQNVTVTTGLTSDSQTEIASGLSEGDTVVTGTSTSTTQTTGTTSIFGGGIRGGFGGR